VKLMPQAISGGRPKLSVRRSQHQHELAERRLEDQRVRVGGQLERHRATRRRQAQVVDERRPAAIGRAPA
jgi:hypothetical protein